MRSYPGLTTRWPVLIAVAAVLTGCSPSGQVAGGQPSATSAPASATTSAATGAPSSASQSSEPPASTATSSSPTAIPTSTRRARKICGKSQPAPLTAADSPVLTSAKVVTESRAGLSVYTASSNRNRVLSPTNYGAAVFRSSGIVTYSRRWKAPDRAHLWGKDAVYQTSLAGNLERQILRLPDTLFAMAWNSDGDKLAYLVYREDQSGAALPVALCLYDAQTGTVKVLGTSPQAILGREGGAWDEWSVAWSPDGTKISVVDDAQGQILRVASVRGRSLLPWTPGTFARWFPDGRLLYAKGSGPVTEWDALNVRTGRSRTIPLPVLAARPAISPDGTKIAFTILKGTRPVSRVLDLPTGTITTLGSNLTTPIWLSPTGIALTRTSPCPEFEPCPMDPLLDKTVGIEITTMTKTNLRLPTTVLGSWSLYDGADVRLPQ